MLPSNLISSPYGLCPRTNCLTGKGNRSAALRGGNSAVILGVTSRTRRNCKRYSRESESSQIYGVSKLISEQRILVYSLLFCCELLSLIPVGQSHLSRFLHLKPATLPTYLSHVITTRMDKSITFPTPTYHR
jgi:hypothetical protein